MSDEAEDLDPAVVLYAFELANGHFAKSRSHKETLHNRWDVALGILDRAMMESDRGMRLLELTNKVERLEEELAMYRKGGGHIQIGPFGI